MLELLKSLLGIEDDSKDTQLQFQLDLAELAVLKYCNIDELPDMLQNSVIKLAMTYYKRGSEAGISSKTQGSRSTSYRNDSATQNIPQDIIATLPLPRIKAGGQ